MRITIGIVLGILLLLLTSMGCQSLQKKPENNCHFLRQLIRNHWKQDPETGYFSFDRFAFRQMGPHWGCLDGSSKRRVERLFGTPTEKRKNVWVYYQSGTVPCEFSNCTYFKFAFDKEDKLREFKQGGAMMKY